MFVPSRRKDDVSPSDESYIFAEVQAKRERIRKMAAQAFYFGAPAGIQ
jgi:hypothetical protein